MKFGKSNLKKKLIFIDFNIKMIADIVVAIFKCLNFIIIKRKLKKKIPPTRYGVQKSKKVEKCVIFAAGLSKVISMKNKKMPNVISFILLINFISKN